MVKKKNKTHEAQDNRTRIFLKNSIQYKPTKPEMQLANKGYSVTYLKYFSDLKESMVMMFMWSMSVE